MTGPAQLLLAALRDGAPGPGQVSPRAHLFVMAVMVALVVSVVLLVRRHRLKSKYSMLWLGLSVVLLAAGAFPGTLDRVSDAIGIDYPPATFLFLSVAFLLMVVVHFSWELSRLEERTRVLAEESALLRTEHERLAGQVAAALGAAPAGPARHGAAAEDPSGQPEGAPEDAGDGSAGPATPPPPSTDPSSAAAPSR